MSGRGPSEEEILGYFKTCSNWGRWGPEDQRGTANFLTASKQKQAASLVQEGFSVSCARTIDPEPAPDAPVPPLRLMEHSGERWVGKKTEPRQIQRAREYIAMSFHGMTITHIDSLGHFFWDGRMYNGYPSDMVTTDRGALVENIELLGDGVVSRGVLLDIPRLRGVPWLEPGEAITPEDLEAAERLCGARVETGDVLLVRTGYCRMRAEQGPALRPRMPGFSPACLPWFHRREIAVLGSDTVQDVTPSVTPRVTLPVHQVGIVAMGLWLIDNANLEDVAEACQRFQRWAFMLTIGPLKIVNGTGSPVNPIATF